MKKKPVSLEEKQISSQVLVDGLLLKAFRDEVELPNGKPAVREYIRHPGAVIMIPLFENGDTMMIRQFRYPVGKTFWEMPAGKLDGPENPDHAAQRELVEEIGYRANKLTRMTEFFPCIGYSDEKMVLYLAEELSPEEENPDEDEFLEKVRMPFRETIMMVERCEIDDMKTIAAILFVKNFLEKNR